MVTPDADGAEDADEDPEERGPSSEQDESVRIRQVTQVRPVATEATRRCPALVRTGPS
ncbi:hypothetical protein GCM10027080_38110 [Pedococcus soli]